MASNSLQPIGWKPASDSGVVSNLLLVAGPFNPALYLDSNGCASRVLFRYLRLGQRIRVGLEEDQTFAHGTAWNT